MTNEFEKKIVGLIKENNELNQKAILAARQSSPDFLSPILFEMRNKIDTLAKAVESIQDKQEIHMVTHTVTDKNTADGLVALQETSKATLEQVKKTNGRVTLLEKWKENTESFASGVKVGGKGMWTIVGIFAVTIWVVFGDFVKRKVGL